MKPLSGIRVLSIEQFASAPYGSMFLADLGAEVIKVENTATGGDPARHTGPYLLGSADSQYFQAWNMNKRSIALDLKSAGARAAIEQLVAGCDAVINNLRGDQPEKLALDYKGLAPIKPSIVCLHISAYGRDNERASWPGYDYLMQAEAGLMHLTGEPDGPPSRLGAPSMIDQMTGITAMVGLLAALIQARSSGKGCDVDASLFDVALHQLGYTAIWYLNEGHAATRQHRSAHYSLTPVQTFPTADGWIFVMCMTDKFWQALLGVLARPELRADERFSTQAARTLNRDALTQILDEEFRSQPTSMWLARLSGVVPVAPVLDLKQTLDNPFLDRTGMISSVQHPQKADLRVLANPLKIDGKRLQQSVCPPVGADNADLLPVTPCSSE